ncbi:cytochrome c oxidase assembly protein [Massilia sp. 9I]|uniref:cytochrome c oxidase assembly protein n=1 Tax=Massilia sp. 9I TaxID=2653152 RepID=UPI0012EFEDA7|nr:cytochrome c oxidase assembly protein [Massilia sp. 9I]VXB95332.1 Cytochrome C oxidase assembly protein [Massilia sp. 9I]
MRKLTLFLCWLLAARAQAHDVEQEVVAKDVLRWGSEWYVMALLALSLGLYVLGAARLWRRAHGSRAALRRQFACFLGGWIVLALALASPIDGAGSLAFSAHMVQHELLMIVAGPLLVLGRPLGAWTWALPAAWRGGVGRATHGRLLSVFWREITRPLTAWLLHFAALWVWHVPFLFQAGLEDNNVHALQHASFLFTGLLFWWAVLGKHRRSAARGAGIVYLFTTMMYTGALGALFTVSESIWYPAYGHNATYFGLTALEDQQLGGLIMWIPAGLVYLAAGLMLSAGWLQRGDTAAGLSLGARQ